MSRVHGDAFEELLNLQHGQYRSHGSAEIFRNEIAGAWKFDRRNDRRVFIPLPRSRPDYTGVITAAPWSIPVYFDAKTTKNTTSWTLDRDSMHQYEMLHSPVNTLCFFLIEFRELKKFVILRVAPWLRPLDWQPSIKIKDVKSLSEMMAAIKEIEEVANGITPDFPDQKRHLVHEAFEFQETHGGLCDWLAALKHTWLAGVWC